MKASLIDKLCCPIDKKDLTIKVFATYENEEILEAVMTCPECHRYFPVIYGIPIMTPDEFREKALEEPSLKKWGLRLQDGTSEMLMLKDKDPGHDE